MCGHHVHYPVRGTQKSANQDNLAGMWGNISSKRIQTKLRTIFCLQGERQYTQQALRSPDRTTSQRDREKDVTRPEERSIDRALSGWLKAYIGGRPTR